MNYAHLAIHNLDLLINLGWPDNERNEKQTVQVDIEFHFEQPPKACTTDNLKDTFCYDDLINAIFEYTAKQEFRLLEHLAQALHAFIKSKIETPSNIIVHVTKHPSIKGFSGNIRFSYGGK